MHEKKWRAITCTILQKEIFNGVSQRFIFTAIPYGWQEKREKKTKIFITFDPLIKRRHKSWIDESIHVISQRQMTQKEKRGAIWSQHRCGNYIYKTFFWYIICELAKWSFIEDTCRNLTYFATVWLFLKYYSFQIKLILLKSMTLKKQWFLTTCSIFWSSYVK